MNSPLPDRVSPSRCHIFALLLDQPKRNWTVRGLAEAQPANTGVNSGAVRGTVNRLLAHRLWTRCRATVRSPSC